MRAFKNCWDEGVSSFLHNMEKSLLTGMLTMHAIKIKECLTLFVVSVHATSRSLTFSGIC